MPCRQKNFTLPPASLLLPDWIGTIQENINNLVHPPGIHRIALMADRAPEVQLVAWYNPLSQDPYVRSGITLEGVKSWLLGRYLPADPFVLGFIPGEGGIVSIGVPQSCWPPSVPTDTTLRGLQTLELPPYSIRFYGIYRTLENYRVAYWIMAEPGNRLLPNGQFPRETANRIKRCIIESLPFRITSVSTGSRSLSLEDEFFRRMEEQTNAI